MSAPEADAGHGDDAFRVKQSHDVGSAQAEGFCGSLFAAAGVEVRGLQLNFSRVLPQRFQALRTKTSFLLQSVIPGASSRQLPALRHILGWMFYVVYLKIWGKTPDLSQTTAKNSMDFTKGRISPRGLRQRAVKLFVVGENSRG